MSQRTKARLRIWALALAGLLCLGGIYGGYAAEYTMLGRDIVESAGSNGGVLSGSTVETLMLAPNWTATSYPGTRELPVTLKAMASSSSDAGWVVVTGVDSALAEVTDSVYVTFAAPGTFRGRWRGVNSVAFHDDSTNVGEIRLWHGLAHNNSTPDSILAVIPPRERVANIAFFTVPAPYTKLYPRDLRLVFSTATTADKMAVGVWGVLKRDPGQAKEPFDQGVLRVPSGMVVMSYDSRDVVSVVPGTELQVAAGVTASVSLPVDASARFRFGLQ